MVGANQHAQPASAAGVGVENISILILVKYADSRTLRLKIRAPPEIVIHFAILFLFRGKGNMIIMVKIVVKGRNMGLCQFY